MNSPRQIVTEITELERSDALIAQFLLWSFSSPPP